MSADIPYVKQVTPLANYRLLLHYPDGSKREFDMSPYLERGFFAELTDEARFRAVRVAHGAVEWESGQDLSPETLYLRSIPSGNSRTRVPS